MSESGLYYSREIKPPKNKQEGLANFVQLIINQLERGETNEALLTAVDLWNDVTSAANIYPVDVQKGAGAKLATLQSELLAKHNAELIKCAELNMAAGKAAARREMAERLGLI